MNIPPNSKTRKYNVNTTMNFDDLMLSSALCGVIGPTGEVAPNKISWSIIYHAKCFGQSEENAMVFEDLFVTSQNEAKKINVWEKSFNQATDFFNLLSSNEAEERQKGLEFFYHVNLGFLISWVAISNNAIDTRTSKIITPGTPIKLYLSSAFSDLTNQQILDILRIRFKDFSILFYDSVRVPFYSDLGQQGAFF